MNIEYWQIALYVVSFLITYAAGIAMYKYDHEITEAHLMLICGFSLLPVINTFIVAVLLLCFPVTYFVNRKRYE